MNTPRLRINLMYVLIAMLLVYCVPVQSAEQIPPQVATESDRPGYSEVRFSAKGPVLEKILQYFRDKGPTVGHAEVLCRDKREELGWRVYYSFNLTLLQKVDLRGMARQIDSVRVATCKQEFRMRGGNHVSGMKKMGAGTNTLAEYNTRVWASLVSAPDLPAGTQIDLYCMGYPPRLMVHIDADGMLADPLYQHEFDRLVGDVAQILYDYCELVPPGDLES